MHDSTRISRQDALYPKEIVKEAAIIAETKRARIQQLTSLGLSVPDDSSLLTIARIYATVDTLSRRSRGAAERLRQAIARCEKRAGAAA